MLVSTSLLVSSYLSAPARAVTWPTSWLATSRVSPMAALMSAYHVAASSPKRQSAAPPGSPGARFPGDRAVHAPDTVFQNSRRSVLSAEAL